VKERENPFARIRSRVLVISLTLAGCVSGWAQNAPVTQANDASSAAIQELRDEVRELRQAVSTMQAETEQYRSENRDLRRQVQALEGNRPSGDVRAQNSYGGSPATSGDAPASTQSTASASPHSGSILDRVTALEESTQLINSKVDDQYQTKVESGSRYRLRLHGLVLLNLFSNRGETDNQDFPSFVTGAQEGNGNFGATVRQSEIGLEVFGPTVWGAKTSGSVLADFAGGFPSTWNGVDSGIFRLKTASARLDWEHTSVVVGQDELFLSPQSPTSYASLAVPAFNYAGNLWAWTPQVRVEHRFELSDTDMFTVQGGILDNLTGSFPADTYFRYPSAGESSGQPAYGARLGWSRHRADVPITFGVAGYYSRQDWQFDHNIDSWAAMADWQAPLFSRLSISGEIYRGRAIAGLNAGIGRSVVFDGNPGDPTTSVHGLDDVGGWSQLKFRATPRLEFNAAFGLDNPFANEARAAIPSQSYVGPLFVQNQSALGNVIFRPRSNLLLSAEYRHLQSKQIDSPSNGAQQVNLMMGIFF
jgi:hypothetical protein